MANLSSDIYDIQSYINQIKKDYINEDENTLILGIFGYLGDVFSKITQNSINMTAELSNEGIATKARYEKNIIAHAFTAGVKNIYSIPATFNVLLSFYEDELFKINMNNQSVPIGTIENFIFDANNKIYFGDFEFHPEYNIQISKTKIKSGTNTKFAYSAKYLISEDSNGNPMNNPISDITLSSSNQYLSPPSIINSGDKKILYIQIPLRQVERSITNKKIVSDNIIENRIISFDFTNQLASFTVDIKKANGDTIRLIPVYDGINTDEKSYLYYQFMNNNLIRCKFIDSIYMPSINDQVYINLQTSQGSMGNFSWDKEVYPKFVFSSTDFGYDNINCQVIPINSESSNGLDKKSIAELKTIISKELLARNSITNLDDLKNFFNQINSSDTHMYIYKKRDNQFERLYYTYFLMKNSSNNIIPTNTIGFSVYLNDDNISTNGETVNITKNDIIEYDGILDSSGTSYGNIISDSIDSKVFGSKIEDLMPNDSPNLVQNYTSGRYYFKKIAGYWYSYGIYSFDIMYITPKSITLSDIGITYTGNSETLIVDYEYAYETSVVYRLSDPDQSVYVNPKVFKDNSNINEIQGTYNFIYDGSDWTFNSEVINLDDFGIIIKNSTSGFDQGNKITINLTYDSNIVKTNISTSLLFYDSIEIPNREIFKNKVNSDDSNNYVFNLINGNPTSDNLLTSVDSFYSDYILPSSISYNTTTFFGKVNNKEGIYKYKCGAESNLTENKDFKFIDIQDNTEYNSLLDFYNKTGISIPATTYYVPAGTNYYSDSSTTTLVDTTTQETEVIISGSNYTISISSTTYYVKEEDVLERTLHEDDIITVDFTKWSLNYNFVDLSEYGINLYGMKYDNSSLLQDNITVNFSLSNAKVIKDDNLFYYNCPYDININKDPIIAYYKLSKFNIDKSLSFNRVNDTAIYQFICTTANCYREYVNNSNIYTIKVEARLNVEDSSLLSIYGTTPTGEDNIISTKIHAYLLLYDTKESDSPSRYTEGFLTSYRADTYTYVYEFKLETDNKINRENRINITEKGLKYPEDGFEYSQYYDGNIKAEIIFAFDKSVIDSDYIIENSDTLHNNVFGTNNYIESNCYNINDGLDLFYNFSNIINSKVTAYTDPNKPIIYKVADRMPYYEIDESNKAYSVPGGTAYYGDSSFLSEIGQTPVDSNTLATYDSINNNYKIKLLYQGIMTEFYVKTLSVTTHTLGEDTFFNNLPSSGSTDKIFSSNVEIPGSSIKELVYDTDNNYGTISFYDNNGILVSKIINAEDINDVKPYYYKINEVPCIKSTYITNEELALELVTKIIAERTYLNYCIENIEDNFSIDFKYFNTYGPSYLYSYTGDEEHLIDRVNISLEFNLKLNNSYNNANIVTFIINDIKSYIENIEVINDIHMHNLTNYITSKYPDNIIYFEFLSVNGHSDWKHIYNLVEDDGYYILEKTPEFLNIDNTEKLLNGYEVIEPSITINLV